VLSRSLYSKLLRFLHTTWTIFGNSAEKNSTGNLPRSLTRQAASESFTFCLFE